MIKALSLVAVVSAIDNGFTRPPMGWSALYGAPFGAVNETNVAIAAEGLNASGLLAAGYNYVVLDDWYADRSADGTIIAHASNFPSGMPAISDKVHAAGCLFGVYSSASERTCGNFTASLFSEARDAKTFANDWKIDMLKYDACIYSGTIAGRVRYQAMQRALNATGRSIRYSVEGWKASDGNWGPDLANQWRTGADIWPNWDNKPNCILNNLYTTNEAAKYHKVGKGFNDPDMLQPPNTLKTVLSPGLTPTEAYSQYLLWVVMKAPLVLGVNFDQLADLQTLEPTYFGLLTNPDLLAINQDLSPQAVVVAQMPSTAQLQGKNGALNVTLQDCDPSRVDQRWTTTATKGQIALAASTLCLTDDTAAVSLQPCSATTATYSLPETETIGVLQSSTGSCVNVANGSPIRPTATKCGYTGPFPAPYDVASTDLGVQMYIWGETTQQIVSGSSGDCFTAGNPNADADSAHWVTNNGTLEHEVWMGDLTDGAAGQKRRAVALFNKGSATDTVVAPAEVIGTKGASGPVKVYDAVGRKYVAPLAVGATLPATLPSHGTIVYILEFS